MGKTVEEDIQMLTENVTPGLKKSLETTSSSGSKGWITVGLMVENKVSVLSLKLLGSNELKAKASDDTVREVNGSVWSGILNAVHESAGIVMIQGDDQLISSWNSTVVDPVDVIDAVSGIRDCIEKANRALKKAGLPALSVKMGLAHGDIQGASAERDLAAHVHLAGQFRQLAEGATQDLLVQDSILKGNEIFFRSEKAKEVRTKTGQVLVLYSVQGRVTASFGDSGDDDDDGQEATRIMQRMAPKDFKVA